MSASHLPLFRFTALLTVTAMALLMLCGPEISSASAAPPPTRYASNKALVAKAPARGGYTRVYSAEAPIQTGIRASSPAQQALQSPQTILARLKAANKIPDAVAAEVQVQQSDVLNAATNGQSIIISSALLEKLQTSDQRAFVISHELSHIVLSHVGKTQLRRTGLALLDHYLVRRYVAEGSLTDMAAQLGLNLYDKRSSRVYEYQADDLGIQIMSQTGYRPQAAIEVFHILQAATPGNATPEFLQDHPITESRIEALVKKYNLSFQ